MNFFHFRNSEQTPPEFPESSCPHPDKYSRYLGCLLGGAIGDALGYPVEFISEKGIKKEYGVQGIQTLSDAGKPAVISDDTQMTLFAANSIIYSLSCGVPFEQALWTAYREWLGTQKNVSRMDDPKHPVMWLYREKQLHALRAPGNTCLAAIRNLPDGGTVSEPANNSKGCGTVMRAAPFGLAVHYDPASDGDPFADVFRKAVCDAAMTHGHPLAWLSSAVLAQIVFEIVQHRPDQHTSLQDAVLSSCHTGGYPECDKLNKHLEEAVRLALDTSVSDMDGIHSLGEGWVAEEALLIAVFCAVRYQHDFAAAIRASVNHKGDSDSTGAVCGNILGAWLGKEALAQAFDLKYLELRDVIETIAADLYRAVEEHPPVPGADASWDEKYRP